MEHSSKAKEMFHLLDQLTIAVEEGWTFEQLEEHELFFQPEYRVPDMVVKGGEYRL